MNDLGRLGAELRRELGEPPPAFSERQRLRLRGLDLTPRPQRAPVFAVLTAAAVLGGAAALAAGIFWTGAPSSRAGEQAVQAAAPPLAPPASASSSEAVWVEASATPAVHRLPDGSSIALEVGARGRLDRGSDLGTRFDLHEGTAAFHVEKQGERSFSVVAGEYRVVVVGTRFTTAYLPPRELRVVVTEGVVEVHSPTRAAPFSVHAGETLELLGEEFSLGTSEPKTEVTAESGGGRATAGGNPSSPGAASWRALYQKGKYQESCGAARGESLAALGTRLDAAGLVDLSSVLRLCGDAPGAMTTLTTLRARYPGTSEAHDALFLMGRLLATSGQARAAAARMDEYLAGGAGSRFAAEALGRLIELHQSLGNQARARASAERYLQLAPEGPYRRLAESLLAVPANPDKQ